MLEKHVDKFKDGTSSHRVIQIFFSRYDETELTQLEIF